MALTLINLVEFVLKLLISGTWAGKAELDGGVGISRYYSSA
jgi:hypothetical protein